MKISELQQRIIIEAKELESYVIDTRRQVHMHPETLYEEENTAKFIEKELNRFGIETQRIIGTGVLATIKGSLKGKNVALRADIDALNIFEETNATSAKDTSRMLSARAKRVFWLLKRIYLFHFFWIHRLQKLIVVDLDQ